MKYAILNRYGRPSWRFTFDDHYQRFVHRTNRGSVYALFEDLDIGKPFWVARLCDNGNGKFWVTCEAELRAMSIEFEGAGTYYFKVAQ